MNKFTAANSDIQPRIESFIPIFQNKDYILEVKSTIEKNITQHGGYMIDEWQYVDKRQIPIDIRSHIRFKSTDEQ